MRRITALILFLFVFSGVKADSMSDFVDSIVNNIQTVDNNAFESQKRGYFVGGGVRYSVPNPTIQPLSFSPPRISAGCGGVDISLGSFSYLKFDDLVQKLQAVLQVAPALAFQLVLSNLCERCQAILSSLESISDIVNSLNMDACTLAKAGVGYAMKLAGVAGENATKQGTKEDTNDWIKTMQTNLAEFQQAIEDWKKEVTGAYDCATLTGADYKKCVNKGANSGLLLEQGLLEYVRVNSRLKDDILFKAALGIMRAYLGDVVIKANGGVNYIEPCSGESIETLKVVCSEKSADTGSVIRACSIGPRNVTSYALDVPMLRSNDCLMYDHTAQMDQFKNMIQDIYARIRNGESLTGDQVYFIDFSVFPVYTYLSWVARAEELGYPSGNKINALSGTLGIAMYVDAFYYRLSIALGSVSSAVSSILKACSNAQKDASDTVCAKESALTDYLRKVRELKKIVSYSRSKIYETFESDFKKLRKDYEGSWRFVMNTLRTYGLEKSYNFSASVE